MKTVIDIKKIGKRKVCDLTVEDTQHYIMENGMISHNTGSVYGANDIWTIGRQQNKDSDKDLLGYHFIITIFKSRLCKEGAKIPITVSFDGGIKKYSGLLELAEEGNFIAKPVKGKYQLVNQDTGELIGTIYKESEIIDNPEVWDDLLNDPAFKDFITNKFTLGNDVMFSEGETND